MFATLWEIAWVGALFKRLRACAAEGTRRPRYAPAQWPVYDRQSRRMSRSEPPDPLTGVAAAAGGSARRTVTTFMRRGVVRGSLDDKPHGGARFRKMWPVLDCGEGVRRPASLERRRLVAIGIGGALFFVATAGPATTRSPASVDASCGVERWRVMTLTDPDVGSINFAPKDTTVDALRSLPAPTLEGNAPRLAGAEMRTYRVRAVLLKATIEENGDIHLFIADPRSRGHTMIVGLPDRTCTVGAPSSRRRLMTETRKDFVKVCGQPGESSFLRLRGTATITGVGFFNVRHRQTGAAQNGVELHPVLGFKSTDCRAVAGSNVGGSGG